MGNIIIDFSDLWFRVFQTQRLKKHQPGETGWDPPSRTSSKLVSLPDRYASRFLAAVFSLAHSPSTTTCVFSLLQDTGLGEIAHLVQTVRLVIYHWYWLQSLHTLPFLPSLPLSLSPSPPSLSPLPAVPPMHWVSVPQATTESPQPMTLSCRP